MKPPLSHGLIKDAYFIGALRENKAKKDEGGAGGQTFFDFPKAGGVTAGTSLKAGSPDYL